MFIDTVLVKVASRCNLDCGYCYIYHMGDETWRSLPKRLSTALRAAIADELADLKLFQGQPFSVVLHGGEPLLLGAPMLGEFLGQLRQCLGSDCGIGIQTNGSLLSRAILDACAQHGATISVSLDGPSDVHDANRLDRLGHPSHRAVIRGLDLLKAHPASERLFSGVLAVINPATEAERVYDYFRDLSVPSVDFLYRDGNRSVMPFGKLDLHSVEYGSWMVRILDRYLSDPAPFRIRVLDDLIRLVLGGMGTKEGVGLTDFGILVIDTDGTVRKNDTLKSSPGRDGFKRSWRIGRDRLRDIVCSMEFIEYHLAQRPCAIACRSCKELRVCGGGMLTHRHEEGRGYDNPTVFCSDQMHLIAAIRARLRSFKAAA